MGETKFDVIVVGLGSMGMAAAHYLAASGKKVLGLEQFGICNDRSSHSGETRLIRKSYFEHPSYVPLLEQAYHNWDLLESRSNETLFHKTGIAYIGDPNGSILSGVLEASRQFDVPVTRRNMDFIDKPKDYEILFEPNAGYLNVPKTFEVLKRSCLKLEATLLKNQKVLSWESVGDCVEVSTENNRYLAEKLVLTAGSWIRELIPQKIDLSITRQVLAWFQNSDSSFDIPCWSLDHPEGKGIYYGFSRSDSGFKIGHHFRGESTHPDKLNREVNEEEIVHLKEVLQRLFPSQEFVFEKSATCMYTNSKDDHFILDFLPGTNQNVVFAAGFSGHGFKFVPVIGEIISDMVVRENIPVNASFLNLDRFKR
jgi:sarcosine oxidase